MCLFSEMVTDSSDKVSASFHSCHSFGWLPPFILKDFLFKHSTVIKTTGATDGIFYRWNSPGFTCSSQWRARKAEAVPLVVWVVIGQGVLLVLVPPRDRQLDHEPSLCTFQRPGPPAAGPTHRKGVRTKGILRHIRPTSSSHVPTRLCPEYSNSGRLWYSIFS